MGQIEHLSEPLPVLALQWVILSGTGDLANIRGQGFVEGYYYLNAQGLQVGGIIGQIHFDPA